MEKNNISIETEKYLAYIKWEDLTHVLTDYIKGCFLESKEPEFVEIEKRIKQSGLGVDVMHLKLVEDAFMLHLKEKLDSIKEFRNNGKVISSSLDELVNKTIESTLALLLNHEETHN